MKYQLLIIGGGVVGLATALELRRQYPDARLAVVEKESQWAFHQSSRNSGVIHAGVYYKEGSKKAHFALAGNASMFAFCKEHEIAVERCGKLIVATSQEQVPALLALKQRATANGLLVEEIVPEAARDIEPHVSCVSALHVPSTGIVDFREVARVMVDLLVEQGVELIQDCEVRGIKQHSQGVIVSTNKGILETEFMISTAGLHADRVARMADVDPGMRIVPFRGEYWHLKAEKQHLVKHLIYPVPNPNFPFLGVHLTRTIHGLVHAGPNAVLALKREGYSWLDVSLRDTLETLTFSGFWKLAGNYLGEGTKEMVRSLIKSAFVRSVQQLVPEIEADDLVRGDAGVRAQALWDNGGLLDDFHIIEAPHSIFVLNAPSPAATASLEIGKHIASLYAQRST